MALLVHYDARDGRIVRVWEGNPVSMLEAQASPDDPAQASLLVKTDVHYAEAMTGYYVQDGVLTPKTVLTLIADPNPFAADGVTTCAITVVPFVPCMLQIEDTYWTLVEEDQVLTLTADSPKRFVVELVSLAAYRADTITVEAI